MAAEDAAGAPLPTPSRETADSSPPFLPPLRRGPPTARRRVHPSSDDSVPDLDRGCHAGERSAPHGHRDGETMLVIRGSRRTKGQNVATSDGIRFGIPEPVLPQGIVATPA